MYTVATIWYIRTCFYTEFQQSSCVYVICVVGVVVFIIVAVQVCWFSNLSFRLFFCFVFFCFILIVHQFIEMRTPFIYKKDLWRTLDVSKNGNFSTKPVMSPICRLFVAQNAYHLHHHQWHHHILRSTHAIKNTMHFTHSRNNKNNNPTQHSTTVTECLHSDRLTHHRATLSHYSTECSTF